MKTYIIALLLVVSTQACTAVHLDDGIYTSSQDGSGLRIRSKDGEALYLGEKEIQEILKDELYSLNNSNKEFLVTVTIPYNLRKNETNDISSYILIVAGEAYSGHGSRLDVQKKTLKINFPISGEQNARLVSEHMGTPLLYRRRPSHELLISFTSIKQEFAIGEEVAIKFQIKNIGINTLFLKKGFLDQRLWGHLWGQIFILDR